MTEIYSNHGIIECDESGTITKFIQEWDDTEPAPYRFDVAEWRQYYGKTVLPAVLDILDIGFWSSDGYISAEEDWRQEQTKAA